MPRGARLNKVIELLEGGRPVFCAAVAQNGDWDGLAQLALSDFDMVIVETEHQGFDLPLLRHSLQHLLHRGRIAAKGSVPPVKALPRQTMSGTMLACSIANIVPVRAKPVKISSRISRAP